MNSKTLRRVFDRNGESLKRGGERWSAVKEHLKESGSDLIAVDWVVSRAEPVDRCMAVM